MNAQQVESLKRAAILLGAMLVPGFVAIYPQLLGDAPLDVHAMIRAFVAAIVGGVISRYGEGVYDGRRAATGNVIKGDVTPPQDAPAVFAPPITAASLRDLLEAVDVLQQWQRPIAPPAAAIGHRIVTDAPIVTGGGLPGMNVSSGPIAPLGADAPVKRSHHAKPPAVLTPIDPVSDH